MGTLILMQELNAEQITCLTIKQYNINNQTLYGLNRVNLTNIQKIEYDKLNILELDDNLNQEY